MRQEPPSSLTMPIASATFRADSKVSNSFAYRPWLR
jgi:hypothetical protein